MKNTFMKSTISAFAMVGVLGIGGMAAADNHDHGRAERAGSRAGASIDRAGNRVGAAADRTGDRMEGAADRTQVRTQNAADRTDNRLDGTRADQRPVGADASVDNDGVKTEVTDTWITTKVKSSFVTEDALDGSDISVDTEKDGVVTLSGTVRNKSAKKRAEVVAKSIEGVKKVNNQLKVVSTRAVSGRDSSRHSNQ